MKRKNVWKVSVALAFALVLSFALFRPIPRVQATTSATATLLYAEVYHDRQGHAIARATYAVTGLASGANTAAFPGAPLPRLPRRVFVTATGNNTTGTPVYLDTNLGAAVPVTSFTGGRLGVDANAVYLQTGASGECEVTVEY
jgi:hypothetical protein